METNASEGSSVAGDSGNDGKTPPRRKFDFSPEEWAAAIEAATRLWEHLAVEQFGHMELLDWSAITIGHLATSILVSTRVDNPIVHQYLDGLSKEIGQKKPFWKRFLDQVRYRSLRRDALRK